MGSNAPGPRQGSLAECWSRFNQMTTSPEEEGQHKTEPELADTTQLILQESHLFAAAGPIDVKMDQTTPQRPVTADVRQQPNAAYVPGRMGQSDIGMPIPSLMRTLDLMPWVPGTLGVYRVLQSTPNWYGLCFQVWDSNNQCLLKLIRNQLRHFMWQWILVRKNKERGI